MIITYFYDEGQPHSCSDWGLEGNDKLPIIVNDGAFNNGDNDDEALDLLFYENDNGVPKYIFINKNMELHYKQNSSMSKAEIKEKIDEMLESN